MEDPGYLKRIRVGGWVGEGGGGDLRSTKMTIGRRRGGGCLGQPLPLRPRLVHLTQVLSLEVGTQRSDSDRTYVNQLSLTFDQADF